VLEDAFNNSYLANQGYKGRYNNDTFYSGQTTQFPLQYIKKKYCCQQTIIKITKKNFLL